MLSVARIATSVLFLLFGLSVSVWISGVPSLKQAFDLTDSELGLMLFCYGLAAVLMAYPNSILIQKVEPKYLCMSSVVSSSAVLVMLPKLASLGYRPYWFVALAGMLGSSFYASFTVSATKLEQKLARPIMSSFHACFSVGAVCGSAVFSLLLARGFVWAGIYPHGVVIICVLVVCFASALPTFHNHGGFREISGSQESVPTIMSGISVSGSSLSTPLASSASFCECDSPANSPWSGNVPNERLSSAQQRTVTRAPSARAPSARAPSAYAPKAPVAMAHCAPDSQEEVKRGFCTRVMRLAIVSALAMFTEGSIGDWGGLYIMRYSAASASESPLLYASFAFSMIPMRFCGDFLAHKFSRRTVFLYGGVVSFLGFAALILFPQSNPLVFLFAAAIGLGLANNVPIIQSCAGCSRKMTIPEVTNLLGAFNGAAILGGPSIIGPISRRFGLRVALCLPLLATFIIASSSSALNVNKPHEVFPRNSAYTTATTTAVNTVLSLKPHRSSPDPITASNV